MEVNIENMKQMHIPSSNHTALDSIAKQALKQQKDNYDEIKNSKGKNLALILESHLNLIRDKVLLTLDQEIQSYTESLD